MGLVLSRRLGLKALSQLFLSVYNYQSASNFNLKVPIDPLMKYLLSCLKALRMA